MAAERAGFRNIAQVEIDEFCTMLLDKNFPDVPKFKDIYDFTYSILKSTLRYYGIKNRKIDLLTAGFPCQPFSIAGQRKGYDDDRFLWFEVLRVITEILPEWIVLENVPGFITSEKGLVFTKCKADLENLGYEVQTFDIPAIGKEACHIRHRIWIVAHRSSDRRGRRNGERCSSISKRELLQEKQAKCSLGSEIKGCDREFESKARNTTDLEFGMGQLLCGPLPEKKDKRNSDNSSRITHTSYGNRERKLQQKGLEQNERRRISNGDSENNSNTNGERFKKSQGERYLPKKHKTIKRVSVEFKDNTNSNNSTRKRQRFNGGQILRPEESERFDYNFKRAWYDVASELCRMDDGTTARMDGTAMVSSNTKKRKKKGSNGVYHRIKACGNGIVWTVAYEILDTIVETMNLINNLEKKEK